jgi:hypothetical protein
MLDYDELKIRILKNYEQRGKIIDAKSVDKYLNDIRKIQLLLGEKGEVDDISFLYNINDVRSVIEDMRGRKVDPQTGQKVPASSNTKRNYYQSVVSVMDALNDYQAIAYYQKLVNDYNKQYKKKVQEGGSVLTPENEEKLIPFDDLQNIVSKLQIESRYVQDKMKKKDSVFDENDMNTFQMFLLLKLYMTHPARNEFGNMLWGSPKMKLEQDKNYCIIDNFGESKLVLNEYKTNGLYDTREIVLDKQLINLFRIWRRLLKIRLNQDSKSGVTAGDPVFYSRFFDIEGDSTWFNSGMYSNRLSKYFGKFFEKQVGKSLSTTAIAKIVISNRNKVDSDNMKKTSNDRGTSVGTLSEVYSQVLPTNDQ